MFVCLYAFKKHKHRVHAGSIVFDSLWPQRLQPTTLLFPWDFPGKNTGVGCHFLLQGILLTQGSSLCLLCLLYWHTDSLPLNHQGNPYSSLVLKIFWFHESFKFLKIEDLESYCVNIGYICPYLWYSNEKLGNLKYLFINFIKK